MGNGGQLVLVCLRWCLCAGAGASAGAGSPQHTPWRLVWTWPARVVLVGGTGANFGASSAWCFVLALILVLDLVLRAGGLLPTLA